MGSEELDLTDFWPEFEAEVRENLRKLEEGLLNLEKEPDTDARVHDLMRLAHTVKGAARLMAQKQIANPAADLEHALRQIREGEQAISSDLISHLLSLLDTLYTSLENARPGQEEEPNATNGSDKGKESAPSSEGAAVERMSDKSSSAPVRPALVPARVETDQLEELTALGTVLHIQHMRLQNIAQRLEKWIGDANTDGRGAGVPAKEPASSRGLTDLREDLNRLVEEMGTTIQALESELLHMRLVPFSVLAPVLRRVVRDAATHLGKRVNLRVEGEQTQIDRQLVGPLQDALIHILRNALDHGIEPADERRAAGKSPVGTVLIRVTSERNMVIIRVQDDGRGVDRERVRERAIQRGVILPSEAEMLSEQEVLRLLFRPGFTTREEVGTYSGQGVGLDAVASIMRRLGGDVDLESRSGQGTTVILRVPMNLALVEVVLLQVGPYTVAVPVSQVETILSTDETVFLSNGARRVVRWQNALLPVISLPSLYDLSPYTYPGQHVLILHSGREQLAIEGVTVQEQITLALRPLPPLIEAAPFVYGASILGDGTVVFVVAADALVRFAGKGGPEQRGEGAEGAEGKRPARILVVDDGVTTRDMLRSALTAAGYEVLTARDGEEAIQVLTREGDVDLVITDVHMPRVDGITLTRRLRTDPAWQHIPVIILSIQADPEDIRRGLEAGATAYLTKQSFEEGALLETIERVL